MISLFDKNYKLSEHKHSINITYPRTVNIIFGNYPYPDRIQNLIIEIKNSLQKNLDNHSNVQGGMTDWKHFIEHPLFKNFINEIINKHQTTHSELFEYFYEKHDILDAWGNEMKAGDSLIYHLHPCLHGILYLTEGCDLILPELNLKLTPAPGDYYILPPSIEHGFGRIPDGANPRYNLIFNVLANKGPFNYQQKIKAINDRKNR
jgi:hypothetical protein